MSISGFTTQSGNAEKMIRDTKGSSLTLEAGKLIQFFLRVFDRRELTVNVSNSQDQRGDQEFFFETGEDIRSWTIEALGRILFNFENIFKHCLAPVWASLLLISVV
jgi:hypothetical protein